jgi:membrane protein YqaA with SNARE-associated domain
MLHRLYMRTLALAASPRAGWWLFGIAFAEASFFPVPPDALLIPMALARPDRAWRLAAICLAGSVIGGALGYLIGYAVFDQLARPLIELYGYGDRFAAFQALYARWGLWLILVKGLTPIPYKIVTITSGFAGFNLGLFIVLSIITRGARFFVEGFLLNRYGARARTIIEERLGMWAALAALGVVVGFIVVVRVF